MPCLHVDMKCVLKFLSQPSPVSITLPCKTKTGPIRAHLMVNHELAYHITMFA